MAATRFSFLAGALLSLAACDRQEPSKATGPASPLPKSACAEKRFEETDFTVCSFNSARHELELIVSGGDGAPLRSFKALESHLGSRAASLLFAMNAGMYDEGGRPIGLYVEDGAERHKLNTRDGEGNFHLKPNGVFSVDREGKASVTTAEAFAAKAPRVRWATQSGPMLVIEGKLHPKFDPNGDFLHIRNGVGACRGGTAKFAISEDPVSFGRFARFFRDELGCPNALYLDGAVSSLWEAGARQDAGADLGPMVAVFRRSPAP